MATRVEIVDYDPAWPLEFERASAELQRLLDLPAAAVVHVGSTSVPGLGAKPLIDIDLTIADPDRIPGLATLLEKAGYQPRGSRHGDGVFAFLMTGQPGRRVYLCPPGSQTHLDRLRFRDALRGNPHFALAYDLLKRQLALLYPDNGDRYTHAKGDFIRQVIASEPPSGKGLVPELAVSNWKTSRDFYCDLIGFEVAYERPEEGFSFLALGNAQLMIEQIGIGRTFEIAGAPLERPFGRGLNLQIRVPDFGATLSRLAAAEIDLYLPFEERWYRCDDHEVGHRQFVLADPDGYLLRLYEDLGRRPFVARQ